MINPSEIDLKSLPWLPLSAKTAFPKNPAIYFAIDSTGRVQYIGRSVNPKVRWQSHHKYGQLESIGNIRIAYLFVDSADLLPQIEMALIEWFDPPLNVASKPVRNSVAEGRTKKDKRLTIPRLGKFYKDLLKIDARINGRSIPVQAQELLHSKLEEREAVIKNRIEYLARQRGVTFDEMWFQVINGTAQKQAGDELTYKPGDEGSFLRGKQAMPLTRRSLVRGAITVGAASR
ncbi:GIY-YIG nuclease family protein [Anabaena sp. 4-3]|uniref:GIY-YIG nuclease family protein n=1 Tax=Anabaena sp. 4-3 TaxID=1811979 RepID=UPI00082B0645|nr:GIY-YIG nuclease family protein [Anabaena sp. 4-3]